MRITQLFVLSVLVIVTTACPRSGEPEIAPADTAVAVPPRDPGAVAEAAQRIELTSLSGESIHAEAAVVPVGVQTQVTVTLHQAPPDLAITAHVVTGSCEQPGPTAADLQPLRTDDAGRGRSEIVIDMPGERVGNGNHTIELRRQEAQDGPALACGAVPALSAYPGSP